MTEILRNLSVLEGLSDELLERLASEDTEVEVRAGDWMIREGEAADRMFIVRSGRVEVIDEGPPEVLIRVFRRGEVVGELALLHTGIRSASVRARRDTQLGAWLAGSIERPRLRRPPLEAPVRGGVWGYPPPPRGAGAVFGGPPPGARGGCGGGLLRRPPPPPPPRDT